MNVIEFPSTDFENLTLIERAMLIEEWQTEMSDNLETIRKTAEAMKALLDARKQNFG